MFTELLRSTGAEPEVLARVLRHEVQRGRVVYGAASSPTASSASWTRCRRATGA